ncbi:MAG: alpha/beta hydrolase [Desulfonatronovibrionaceae bacterium]
MDTGVVLIHGFGGTPKDLEGIKQELEKRGAEVRAPLLPGHGTNVFDLQRTRFWDWYAAVEKEYQRLSKEFKQVYAVGFSMGGTLALRLAELHSPAGITCIASPVYLYSFFPPQATDWGAVTIPLLRFMHPYHRMDDPDPVSQKTAPSSGYTDYQPLHAIHSFIKGMRLVRRNLERVNCPLFLLHCPQDKTVLFRNAWEILSRVSSNTRRLEVININNLSGSAHMLPTHEETRDRVRRMVAGFVFPPPEGD